MESFMGRPPHDKEKLINPAPRPYAIKVDKVTLGEETMSEHAATESPQNQIPRLTNRLSVALNLLHENIDGLHSELNDYMYEAGAESEEREEPNPSLCTAADYFREKARLVDNASEKVQQIIRCVQI